MESKTTLSPEQLSEIQQTLTNWFPETDFNTRDQIGSFLISDVPKPNNFMLHWIERINHHTPWLILDRDIDVLSDIFLYYIIGLIFAISHLPTLLKTHGPNAYTICEDLILRMSIICVCVDKLLDNQPPEKRSLFTSQMKALMKREALSRNIVRQHEEAQDVSHMKRQMISANVGSGPVVADVEGLEVDPKVLHLYKVLTSLIDEVPASLPKMMEAFMLELDSVKQTTKLSYEELFSIESKKGTSTYELLGILLNNGTPLHVPIELGIVLQFYDDLTDINADQELGITTVTLLELRTNHNVDQIIYTLFHCIRLLPSTHWLFKIIMSSCISLFVSQSTHVSPTLSSLFTSNCPVNTPMKESADTSLVKDAVERYLSVNLDRYGAA